MGSYCCNACRAGWRDIRPWPAMAFVVVRAGHKLVWLPLCDTCGRAATATVTTSALDAVLGAPVVVTMGSDRRWVGV